MFKILEIKYTKLPNIYTGNYTCVFPFTKVLTHRHMHARTHAQSVSAITAVLSENFYQEDCSSGTTTTAMTATTTSNASYACQHHPRI